MLKGELRDGDGGITPTASYYHVDGKSLGERNPRWLQDDYVKFIRWAQWRLEQTGHGILAFITNHGYLDNPTFRGMRWSLMQAFDEIYVVDLHGSTKKKEIAPDGSPDQNVFDIQQGVAIGIFVKHRAVRNVRESAIVRHAEVWGSRASKYRWLSEMSVTRTPWEIVEPAEPLWLFKPLDQAVFGEYSEWPTIKDLFPVRRRVRSRLIPDEVDAA